MLSGLHAPNAAELLLLIKMRQTLFPFPKSAALSANPKTAGVFLRLFFSSEPRPDLCLPKRKQVIPTECWCHLSRSHYPGHHSDAASASCIKISTTCRGMSRTSMY